MVANMEPLAKVIKAPGHALRTAVGEVSLVLRLLLAGAFILAMFWWSVYLLPTGVAQARRKKNTTAIFNLVLGWTFFGWVIALVWASKHD